MYKSAYSMGSVKTKRQKVFFTKTDIMSQIGGIGKELESLLSDDVKLKVGFKKGHQKFRDIDVFNIYKDMYPLKNETEIKEMIRY